MASFISRILNHDYLAPVTEPLKTIKSHALMPIEDFLECAARGLDEKNYSERDRRVTPVLRVLNEAWGTSGFFANAIAWIGGPAAGVAGAITAGVLAYNGLALTGFASFCAVVGSGLAAGLASVAAGPFVLAAAVGVAGAAVGLTLGAVPAFFRGCQRVARHGEEKRKLAAAEAERQKRAALTLEQQISALQPDLRQQTFENVFKKFPDDFGAAVRRTAVETTGLKESVKAPRPITFAE